MVTKKQLRQLAAKHGVSQEHAENCVTLLNLLGKDADKAVKADLGQPTHQTITTTTVVRVTHSRPPSNAFEDMYIPSAGVFLAPFTFGLSLLPALVRKITGAR